MLELVTSHSDDWFTFPIAATAGHVVTLHEAAVIDAFGERWTLTPPDDGWSLFAVSGLDPSSLVLWSAVTTPLTGPSSTRSTSHTTRTPTSSGRSSGAFTAATCPHPNARRGR
jgi:hypothetical protein